MLGKPLGISSVCMSWTILDDTKVSPLNSESDRILKQRQPIVPALYPKNPIGRFYGLKRTATDYENLKGASHEISTDTSHTPVSCWMF